jgi:hypothetical protein
MPAGILAVAVLMVAGAGAETAEYTVTFESTWSAATHPIDFPPNPHFSGLIGGTHNDQVTFWAAGTLASPGIQSMAETGSKTLLDGEVQAAIGAGTADGVVSGGGIGSSPGSVSKTFDVDDAFPRITLVSMLAPSPDWFVGVSGLILRENDDWIPVQVVTLHVYDAGTDSGPSYRSPNQPTVPPVPVVEHMAGPFATNNVVGTFTFVRTTPTGASELTASARTPALVSLGPNPTRGTGRFEIRVPAGLTGDLSVHNVGGQRVRALFRGRTDDASRIVAWDGRNGRGALVPAGVYYVTLQAGREVRTRKIVVTR